MFTYTYKDVLETFGTTECKLLTTHKEYTELLKETKPSNVKLNIIASCGHNNTVIFKNFKFKNAGVLCKDCKNKKLSETLKEKITHNCFVKREIDFTRVFQSFIEKAFDNIITNEGCESDVIVKPKGIADDKWLRIQIKLTEDICEYDKVYRFSINNIYKDHIIICHCIQKDVYWLIPGENISCNKLSIGQYGGKYFEYYTLKEDIQKQLDFYYNNNIRLYSKEECLIPKNESSIKEYVYRQKIYNHLPFLNIEKPEYTNMVYDLIINDKKIQEKVMTTAKTEGCYTTSLYKRQGKKGFQNYNCYDNDIYWFHIPETSLFFVIPEFELYKMGLLSLYDNKGKKNFHLYINYQDKYWANQYLFNYEQIDISRFLKVLNEDCVDMMSSLIYIRLMDTLC